MSQRDIERERITREYAYSPKLRDSLLAAVDAFYPPPSSAEGDAPADGRTARQAEFDALVAGYAAAGADYGKAHARATKFMADRDLYRQVAEQRQAFGDAIMGDNAEDAEPDERSADELRAALAAHAAAQQAEEAPLAGTQDRLDERFAADQQAQREARKVAGPRPGPQVTA